MQIPDFILISSFRYCLGRRTYIVSDFISWLLENYKIENLSENAKSIMIKDIEFNKKINNLGDDCDEELWIQLLCVLKK